MKPLFVRQLETLKKNNVEQRAERLGMYGWCVFDEGWSCGFAACVLGDHALNGDLVLFGINGKGGDINDTAHTLSVCLFSSCIDLTGYEFLACSIYSSDSCDRFMEAESSKIFTKAELLSFKHLNEDSPTPQDAADYIQAVIEKLTVA